MQIIEWGIKKKLVLVIPHVAASKYTKEIKPENHFYVWPQTLFSCWDWSNI